MPQPVERFLEKEFIPRLEALVQTPPHPLTIEAMNQFKPSHCEAVTGVVYIEAGLLRHLYAGIDKAEYLYTYIPSLLTVVNQYKRGKTVLDDWARKHLMGQDETTAMLTFIEKQLRLNYLAKIWRPGDRSGFAVIDAMIDHEGKTIFSPFTSTHDIHPLHFRIIELGAERYKRLYIATFGQPYSSRRNIVG